MTFSYPGNELDLFQHAVGWKRYYAAHLRPYIKGDVLEVGAGIGATSRFLCDGSERSWTALEPDGGLAARLREALASRPLAVPSRAICGTLDALPADARFDTVLYIDVLEHIEHDRAELVRASGRLTPGGRVVVLSPAHQWLFSKFDQSIGHYRRYTSAMLAAITPSELRLERTFYLDSIGMLASLANRMLLKEAYPTLGQIRFWDAVIVPASRPLDLLTRFRLGKTVVAIWTTPAGRHRSRK